MKVVVLHLHKSNHAHSDDDQVPDETQPGRYLGHRGVLQVGILGMRFEGAADR